MEMPIAIIIIIIMVLAICQYVSMAETNTYIVHMEKSQMPESFIDHTEWYGSSLKSVSQSAEMFYTYNHVLHGFSTSLTLEEARIMEAQTGVLSVFPESRYELHTTHSPSFLHLDHIPSTTLQPSSDIVIGVLDSGVWPESPSLNDTGIGPIPKSWNGICEVGTNFTASMCNKKLVGARYFFKGYEKELNRVGLEFEEVRSARDYEGHGTHTSTTAAGSSIPGAGLFGYANGTARGMVPQARVAAYKICWPGGCVSSDILAAMDQAIADKVDVISMSIGGSDLQPYYNDTVAIGAFAAMEKGIFVSCAAGNGGPMEASLSNAAPWITTVGAGTLDRDFPAPVKLGNGEIYNGTSLYSGTPLYHGKLVPFVYAGNANKTGNGSYCVAGSLIPQEVQGKIVLCDRGYSARVEKAIVVKEAGGVGMVLANNYASAEEMIADAHIFPATLVGFKAGKAIKKYLSSASGWAQATILFEGTKLGIEPSPLVAAFSSRGPNLMEPQILKPDMIAPGVNILAGWTGAAGPTGLDVDERQVNFNIMSGTSMSCPHVSGLAAMLKAAHPKWSPAAIRSALMTTAYSTYEDGKPILDASTMTASTPFDHGAGHVNPVAALDPGLVYDLNITDYFDFLCALNYSHQHINTVAKTHIVCSPNISYSVNYLNYPSFAVSLHRANSAKSVVVHKRRLTNVASPSTTYNVSISSTLSAVKITVDPESLTFSKEKKTLSYTVTFDATSLALGSKAFGQIAWSNGKYVVKSPFAITWT